VVAKVVGEPKGEKIKVFKYKPKVRYRRMRGHRQLYTRIEIERIER
jgi:large subunit ribosomal protein L21